MCAAAAFGLVIGACTGLGGEGTTSTSARGNAFEIAFAGPRYEGGFAVPEDGTSVVIGGRALMLRSGAEPVTLTDVSFARMDAGLTFQAAAILEVEENNGGVFNGTCGSLPFREERGEWISHPLEGYTVREPVLFVVAIEVRSTAPETELLVEGLRLSYTRSGTRFVQEFFYRYRVGPRGAGKCSPDRRRSP